MDERTIWLSVLIVGGVLAIANAWRGSTLIKSGERERGRRHMIMGAMVLMLMAAALLLQQQA